MDEQFQDLFKIRRNRKKVEIGNILIAEPFLQGKYFSRSVIFMVEHDEKGSIGFVLNKPMAYTTSDLVTELAGLEYPVALSNKINCIIFIIMQKLKMLCKLCRVSIGGAISRN